MDIQGFSNQDFIFGNLSTTKLEIQALDIRNREE